MTRNKGNSNTSGNRLVARLAALALAFSLTGILAACGSASTSPASVPETTAVAAETTATTAAQASETKAEATVQAASGNSSVSETVYPLVLTDAKGVEVSIQAKPTAIASISLGADEILLSLVETSRLAALSTMADQEGLSNVIDQAKGVANRVGADVEAIINLKPDLVIVSDWTDDKVVQPLRDAGITVYALRTATGIEMQQEDIRTLATIVGEPEKGDELTAWMDAKLKAVADRIATLKDSERLSVLSLDSFMYTYGSETTFDSLCTHAGVTNLASAAGLVQWNEMTKEKVVEMNPGMLVLPAWSYEGFDANAFAEDFRSDASLAGVDAIKSDRVFALPEAHTTAVSQYVVLGVEDLAKAAYPDLFQ